MNAHAVPLDLVDLMHEALERQRAQIEADLADVRSAEVVLDVNSATQYVVVKTRVTRTYAPAKTSAT